MNEPYESVHPQELDLQQSDHSLARRREAEEAVETLYLALDWNSPPTEEELKALEFLSWEAGVLDYFKRLRDE